MHAAKETSRRNDTPLHLARMDLVSALRPGTIDVLTCHPPYVPTSSEQLDAAHAKAAVTSSSTECMEDAARTWAGGPNGRAVFDRMIDALPSALSPTASRTYSSLRRRRSIKRALRRWAFNAGGWRSTVRMERRL